jgi:sugar lactone lactonase YvrE
MQLPRTPMQILSRLPAIALTFFFPVLDLEAQTVDTLVHNLGALDALTVGPDGHIFASEIGRDASGKREFDGTTIYRIKPEGTVSVFTAAVKAPLGSALDEGGNLYVSGFTTGTIVKINPLGHEAIFAQGLDAPSGIAMDTAGNLYVANYGSGNAKTNPGRRISRITPDRTVSDYAVSMAFNGPVGLAFDESGNLYVANFNDGRIHRVSPAGEISLLATIPGPVGFAVGYITFARSSLFATAIGENRVYRVSLTGDVTPFAGSGEAGSADGPAATAQFYMPNGIAASPAGDALYVSEYGGTHVRRISFAPEK